MTIYEDALNAWGIPAQERQAIEECSELIKALCKNQRYDNKRPDDVIDEIADVYIMVEQLKLIYGPENVENKIKEKLERLKQRLEK